jgi:hypothetical protein
MLLPKPVPPVRRTYTGPTVPDNLSINDNYDPVVAVQQTAFGALGTIGTPDSDCYGLWPDPFTECQDLLSILEKDNRISAYYELLYQNVSGPNISLPFVEGTVRAILAQAADMPTLGDRFITSIIGHLTSDSWWETPEGEKIGIADPRYSDFSLDRTGWFFNGNPQTATERLLYDAYREAMELFSSGIGPLIPFDITGNNYSKECTGRPFTVTAGSVSALIGWVQAVAEWGPDAVRRGDYTGEYYQGQPSQVEQEATFFNMCLSAKECIKQYRLSYPVEYESDVNNLTPEQLEILTTTYTADADLSILTPILNSALVKIQEALTVALDPRYYTGIDGITSPVDYGIMHNEALYRVAISLLAFKNTINLILESFVGSNLSNEVQDYNDYIDDLLTQQEEEYERRLEEDAERRAAREIAEAERLKVCILPPATLKNECTSVRQTDAKSFISDWTVRNDKETFYDPDKKVYYVVYDVVSLDLGELQRNSDSYMLASYDILDEKYKLDAIQRTLDDTTSQDSIRKFMKLEDLYLEPRAYKPSKILFSLDEVEMNKFMQGTIVSSVKPRVGEFQPPTDKFIKTYTFSIEEFFQSLEAFEGILKKYVFDYALWKVTFGNETLAVQNLAISASSIFNKLKIGILKQDSKNFQNFRPIFYKLLSKNGVAIKQDPRSANIGDYLIDDRIILTFTFNPGAGVEPPKTVAGSGIVDNTPISTASSPPTKNAGSGLAPGMVGGTGIKLFRAQIKSASRPPVDLVWKSDDPFGGELDGINGLEVFKQETAMNYLMNLDTLLNYLLPNKNDRV